MSLKTLTVVFGLLIVGVAAPLVLLQAATTEANFAKRYELGRNRLAAATIDVTIGSEVAPLTVGAMAPGDTATLEVLAVNSGSVPLKLSVGLAAGDSALNDLLLVTAWLTDDCNGVAADEPVSGPVTARRAATLDLIGDSGSGSGRGTIPLAVGEATGICVAFTLPLNAPDDVQGLGASLELILRSEQDPDGGTRGDG